MGILKTFTDYVTGNGPRDPKINNEKKKWLSSVIKYGWWEIEYDSFLDKRHGLNDHEEVINVHKLPEARKCTVDIKESLGMKYIPVNFGKVDGVFNLNHCRDLKTLEGSPYTVKEDFTCDSCYALTSLVGAPVEVGGVFSCNFCQQLQSLEGIPHKVSQIYVRECPKLRSLKGFPVGMNDRAVVENCQSLPEEEMKLFHSELRDEWLKSGMEAYEFNHKRRGQIKGKNFGI